MVEHNTKVNISQRVIGTSSLLHIILQWPEGFLQTLAEYMLYAQYSLQKTNNIVKAQLRADVDGKNTTRLHLNGNTADVFR